jgi:predicted  nucleic acid-binding Zn-ribbon protein
VEDQIHLLMRLQELELAIRRFEEAIAAKPHELDPLIQALDAARASATHHRKALEALDKQRRQLESTIQEEQANLQKAQRKLLDVKTNKEYAAMLAEIESFKQRIAAHEDTILQLMEQAEACKQELLGLEEQISGAERRLAEGRRRNEAELSVLQQTLTERQEARTQALRCLDRPLTGLYQRLLSSRKGLAVVGIKNGTCQGCFLALPPQLMQEVRRNDRILTCSHCQRILFWSEQGMPSPPESSTSELVR